MHFLSVVNFEDSERRYSEFVRASSELQIEDVTTKRVGTLAEAVETAGKQPCDIVFLDVTILEFDDTDVVFELKQVLNCPIILLSAIEYRERESASIAQGAADVIHLSSVTSQSLHRVIEQSLERHKLEQDKQKLIAELVEASFENQRILDALEETNDKLSNEIDARNKTESENTMLVKAINQISDEVFISDSSNNIVYQNHAFLENQSLVLKTPVGLSIAAQLVGHDERLVAEVNQCLSNGTEWRGRVRMVKESGAVSQQQISLFPIKTGAGDIEHYISIKRDVTREMELEKRLVQSQKLQSIGQLAAGIAHEINTPTQYVSDNISFLGDSFKSLHKILNHHVDLLAQSQARSPDGAVDSSLLEKCQAEIENEDLEFLLEEIPLSITQSADGLRRIAKIVLAMKDFSHPGTEEKIPSDINKAIRSTVAVCANEWKYVAEVETELEPGLPMVRCFVGELNQVILNMIVNSAHAIVSSGKFNDAKGKIVVRTRQEEDLVAIRIGDNGSGIPDAVKDKIFDPFFTTKEVGKGTGQGLAMAYSTIVEMHNGTIDVESSPGNGTEFTIRIPVN